LIDVHDAGRKPEFLPVINGWMQTRVSYIDACSEQQGVAGNGARRTLDLIVFRHEFSSAGTRGTVALSFFEGPATDLSNCSTVMDYSGSS
jgi:hypothetical protein